MVLEFEVNPTAGNRREGADRTCHRAARVIALVRLNAVMHFARKRRIAALGASEMHAIDNLVDVPCIHEV